MICEFHKPLLKGLVEYKCPVEYRSTFNVVDSMILFWLAWWFRWSKGGQADWGIGTGQLSIWVDDLLKPVLITPLNLDATLHLNNGRAFVGFTAATGEDTWEVCGALLIVLLCLEIVGSALSDWPTSTVNVMPQVHDILDWTFTSLRRDPAFHYPSVVVNGVGAYQCTDTKHCVHP